jgi:hypothetical protein
MNEMELVVEPDFYSPSTDEAGNYIDRIPSFNIIKKGVYCPCGSRKDKLYESNISFTAHIKSKIHQKWLLNLNSNKINYYIENLKLQETIQNQRLIIAKLDKDTQNKSMTIDYLTTQLTNQLNKNDRIVTDLLDFD